MSDRLQGSLYAAELVWPQQSSLPSAGKGASSMRRQGTVQGLIGGLASGVLFVFGFKALALVAGVIATVVMISALVAPNTAFAAIERWIGKLKWLIGSILSWLLLVPVFVLFFVPFGVLFRRGQRDSMKRFYDKAMPSYWTIHEEPDDVHERLKRQY